MGFHKGAARLACAGLLAASTGLHAATVSFSNTLSGPTDVTNQPISLAQFDPTLGALNSASFSLAGSMNTSLVVVGDDSYFVGWDKLTYSMSLVGSAPYDAVAVSNSLAATRLVGTGTPGTPFVALGGGANMATASNTSTFNGPVLNLSQGFVLTGDLLPFVGSGLLSFFLTTLNLDTVSAAGLQTGGVPPNAGTRLSTNVTGTVSVTYDYSPVPVPAALPLLLSGLGLFGFLARRRG